MIRSTDSGACNTSGGDGGAFGSYEEGSAAGRRGFAGHFDPFARFEALPDMFRHLAAEISSMISLQIALLKAEVVDGTIGYVKGGLFLVIAAIPAVLTALFLEIALGFFLAALFPFSLPVNIGIGFGIMMLLNAVVAGVLAWVGVREFRKHSLVPKRSIQELERDKQWLTSEVM